MNKKIWGVVIIIIIIIMAVWSFQNKKTSVNGKPIIKIGLVAPMTGGASVYGVNLVKGAQLALKNLGDTKNEYQLIIEDDGTNPAQSASAAQKLVSTDKVQALLSVTSGTGNAVKPIAASANIVHICLCSDSRVADAKYNFTNILMAPDETMTWLKQAQSIGIKKIAILAQNQPGFNLIIESLRPQATTYGISIVYDERIEPTVKDFNTNIAKAKAAKPDLILIGFFPPQLDIIGQQLKNLGVTNIAGIATFSIGADPSLFNDKWYSDASLSDPTFADQFIKEFPDTRFNVRVAPYAFDSLNLLVNGFESGKPVNEYILGLSSYSGKAGTLTKNVGDGSFHAPIGIWEIKDGKPVEIK